MPAVGRGLFTDSMTCRYLIGQKFVGQNCQNFVWVSKILSDEKFCPLKIVSNISIQKSGKNLTKLSKFRLSLETLSDEMFCLTKCCPTKFCLIRYFILKVILQCTVLLLWKLIMSFQSIFKTILLDFYMMIPSHYDPMM